jgi:predicted O-methyltransferase YrrM
MILAAVVLAVQAPRAAAQPAQDSLDAQVRRVLNGRAWHELNVPASDGRLLHDLIVQRRFTRVLEVGTSTGHSAIWMAWALNRTGGRLVTIEIDERRHGEAMRNFRDAGLSHVIDARLADAHELVPALPGPFDLAFVDADKDWNLRYFQAILPKLAPDGCIATHNISRQRRRGDGGYLAEVERTPGTTTELVGTSIALTCRV